MGIPCCFTDHSLFGFADTSSILTNKLLAFTLSDVDNVICVSHTRYLIFISIKQQYDSKENTVLRAALDPHNVFVIPNAINPDQFIPDPDAKDPRFGNYILSFYHIAVTIVVLSRLVYRKGVDLLVSLIPPILQGHPRVRFIIAGDGPKKIDLEQMREQYDLHDRVDLVGPVSSDLVSGVLNRGHIFLNCSLTEAFCMAILEAACCGLLVVSTRVGGVPEVLPVEMLLMARPETEDLVRVLGAAIERIQEGPVPDPWAFHTRVRRMYSWHDVAERTEKVLKASRFTL